MPSALHRRELGTLLAGVLLGCSKARPADEEDPTTLRIGYQKSGTLALLKWRSTLERELEQRHARLEWAEFPSGPALLEALNASQIELGFVGEAPPIFAQAASDKMVYVAAEPAAPRAEAIVVRADSPIRNVAELKGRTLALNKGSNVHYFVVKALEQAGLAYADVKLVFLPPADARAAFEHGTVDAWAIWDPYLAAVEVSLAPRVLASAEGIAPNQQLYVAARDFAEQQGPLLQLVLDHVRETDAWVSRHTAEAADHLAQQLSIDPRAARLSLERAEFGIEPITELSLDNQQRIADSFFALGLLPRRLKVRDALPVRTRTP